MYRTSNRGILQALAIIVIVLTGISVSYAAQWVNSLETDFNQGTYDNTTWNVDHVELSNENISGTYTSQLFDATSLASWDSISWESNLSEGNIIYLIDKEEEVYRSSDQGVTWTLINSDFSNNDDDVKGIVVDSNNYLYAVDNGERIYKSINFGSNWTEINLDYGGSDTHVMIIDSNNYLYIIDNDEDVWKSTNLGIDWTKINTGYSTQDAKGITINSSDTIFIVDKEEDIWSSSDQGITWDLVNNNYGGTDADSMALDSNNYLYILNDQDVWRSTDVGTSWIKLHDDFNAGAGANGDEMIIDGNDYIYIIDHDEDVWKSTDYGSTWNLVNDTYSSNDVKGAISVTYNTNISFQVRSCDDASCIGESWSNNTIVSDNRYFQYNVLFESEYINLTPELYNVTINYTLLDVYSPSIDIIYPINTTYDANVTELNYTASDDNLESCWYSLDFGLTNVSVNCTQNITNVSSSEGNNTWKFWANDSLGNLNLSSVTFEVDTTEETSSSNPYADSGGSSNDDDDEAEETSEEEEEETSEEEEEDEEEEEYATGQSLAELEDTEEAEGKSGFELFTGALLGESSVELNKTSAAYVSVSLIILTGLYILAKFYFDDSKHKNGIRKRKAPWFRKGLVLDFSPRKRSQLTYDIKKSFRKKSELYRELKRKYFRR
jgi:photosystem II stability/assembly factor-like uncharacterized protein